MARTAVAGLPNADLVDRSRIYRSSSRPMGSSLCASVKGGEGFAAFSCPLLSSDPPIVLLRLLD